MGLFDTDNKETDSPSFLEIVGTSFERTSPLTGFGLFRKGEGTSPFGPFADAGISLTAGALKSPLVQMAPPLQAINTLARAIDTPNVDELASRIAKSVEGRPLSKVYEVTGELAPELMVGAKLFNLGRQLAVKSLQVNAPRLEAAATRMANRNRAFAAGLGDPNPYQQSTAILKAEWGASLADQLRNVAIRSQQIGALPGAAFAGKPLVERAAEVLGGNLGIAGMVSALKMMDSGDINEATRYGLLAMVLGTVAEGSLVGLGRVVGRGRADVVRKIEDRFANSPELQQIKAGGFQEGVLEIEKANEAVRVAAQASKQQEDLVISLMENPRVFESGRLEKKLERELEKLHGLLGAEDDAVAGVRKAASGAKAKGEFIAPFGANKTEPVLLNVTTANAPNPDGQMGFLRGLYTKILQTPEGFMRQAGVTGMRFLQKTQIAEYERLTARAQHEQLLDRLSHEAFNIRKARGEISGAIPRDGSHLAEVVEVAEKQGIEGVERLWGSGMSGLVREIEEAMIQKYERLVELGALNPMDMAELNRQGVKFFFPHVFKHMNDEQIKDKLIRHTLATNKGMSRHEAEYIVQKKMLSSGDMVEGPLRFGSQEFRRGTKGSLRDKITATNGKDLFEEDPIVALQRYFDALDRNLAYGKQFGFGNTAQQRTKALVLSMAEAEGANRELMAPILDHILNYKYHPEAMRRFVQSATSLQTAAKLTWAVFPNMSQTVNTLMFTGMKNTGKALDTVLKTESREEVARILALYESLFQSVRRSYMGQTTKDNFVDRMADMTLRYTGFESTEKLNRMIGGSAGLHMLRDTAAKAFTGRLRGSSWDAAARKMATLDIDLKQLVLKGKPIVDAGGTLDQAIVQALGNEAIDMAMFKAAQITQFVPDVTRRPIYWSTPLGRLATQFKTFALNQGRFMKDQILLEAAHGNMEPLAYALSVYPIAGDLVKTTVNNVKGKKRKRPDGVERYLEDMTTLGSLGLATSLSTSLKYGDLGGFLFGPTFSDGTKLSEGIYRAISDQNFKALQRVVTRQPAWQATKRLMDAGHEIGLSGMHDYVDAVTASPKRSDPMVDEIQSLIRGNKGTQ